MDWPLAVTIVGVVWGVVAFFAVMAWAAVKAGSRTSTRPAERDSKVRHAEWKP